MGMKNAQRLSDVSTMKSHLSGTSFLALLRNLLLTAMLQRKKRGWKPCLHMLKMQLLLESELSLLFMLLRLFDTRLIKNYQFIFSRTTSDVMSGIVTKCIAAPRAKTKDLAIQVILMYIEIEKHEAVQEELVKGTEAKNPKIVSACIATLTLALKEFGPKAVNIKPLMKKVPALLEDRDKTVRDETKALVVEIYR